MRIVLGLVAVALAGSTARADVVYVEAFGKAGAYGVGYEYAITPRLSLGATASYLPLRRQHLATVVPYLHAILWRRGANAVFGELGAALVYSKIASPVMDWEGASETGGGGVAGFGWERSSRHLVFRAGLDIVVGEGGVAPWGGIAIGVRP